MTFSNSRNWLLVAGLLTSTSLFGGLVTTASSSENLFGSSSSCSIAGSSLAACSSTAVGTQVASQAAASYGFVQAGIQGYASGPVDARASASAQFTDTLTIYGGGGAGILTELIQVVNVGTGSLQSGTIPYPYTITQQQFFSFGTSFDLSLSAIADGSFMGMLCDGGSLTVSKNILSLSVTDVAGHPLSGLLLTDASNTKYNLLGGTFEAATAAPEPSAWILMAIGLVLVGVFAKPKRQHDSARAVSQSDSVPDCSAD